MKIGAFLSKPTKKRKEIAQKCLEIISDNIPIYSIPQYRPDIISQKVDLLIVFGKEALSLLSKHKITNVKLVEIHDPDQLQKKEIYAENRKVTYEVLQQLKSKLKEENTEKDISINEENIKNIIDNTLSVLVNKDGQKIIIDGPEEKDQDALNISMEEIYKIKTIIDTLKVKTVTIRKK